MITFEFGGGGDIFEAANGALDDLLQACAAELDPALPIYLGVCFSSNQNKEEEKRYAARISLAAKGHPVWGHNGEGHLCQGKICVGDHKHSFGGCTLENNPRRHRRKADGQCQIVGDNADYPPLPSGNGLPAGASNDPSLLRSGNGGGPRPVQLGN